LGLNLGLDLGLDLGLGVFLPLLPAAGGGWEKRWEKTAGVMRASAVR
jgi:hypothetical protein